MANLKPLIITPLLQPPPTQSSINSADSNLIIDERCHDLLRLSCSSVQNRRMKATSTGISKSRSSRYFLPDPPSSSPFDDLNTQHLYSDLLRGSLCPVIEEQSFSSMPHSAESIGSTVYTSACIERVEGRRSRLTRAKAIVKRPNARQRKCNQLIACPVDHLAAQGNISQLHARDEEQDWSIFIDNNYVASEASTSASSFTNSTPSSCTPTSASWHDGDSILDHGLSEKIGVIQSDGDSPASVYSFNTNFEARSAFRPRQSQDEALKEEDSTTLEVKRITATRELIQKLREERRRLQQGLVSRSSAAVATECITMEETISAQSEAERQDSKDTTRNRVGRQRNNLEQLQIESTQKISRRPSKPDAPQTPHTGNSARMVYIGNFSPSSAYFGNAVINVRASMYAASIIDDSNPISFSIGREQKGSSREAITSAGFCFDYDPQSPF